jgi:hypothetical protein
MSERNGDRARFQKNRKRKLLHRQRIHAMLLALRQRTRTAGEVDVQNGTRMSVVRG